MGAFIFAEVVMLPASYFAARRAGNAIVFIKREEDKKY